MKKNSYLYRNGLSIVFVLLFIITLAAQILTGWKQHNQDRDENHAPPLTLSSYMTTGHCVSSTFENFQSEFLQMALYVLLTVGLRQKGSAESKKIDEQEEVDREPVASPNAPWPVRKGGWILKLYSNSLSIVFFTLFFISWGLHFYGSLEGVTRPLQPITQKGGKKVMCWAVNSDIQLETLHCNTFDLEWPPKSGKIKTYPEIDKYGWFAESEAFEKINEKQRSFLEEVYSWRD